MLDGLLGRNGFSSKCKSLIKPTRTRIAALRRREEAKQRFLKEDLAKLLANGLDVNAYGRTEEFIAGLNLLACYTFLDQSCEYILKQLSVMQKLGQCPEECRETVSSLMFAAARFSDLPELRDLRNVFQERYGNGLECYVNQVFVEKLASKPPAVEKRIKLLQDIASELSIRWDSKGFKQRMEKPSTLAQALGSVSGSDDEHKPPNGNNIFRKNDQRSKERVEHAHQGPTLHDDRVMRERKERNGHKYELETNETRDNNVLDGSVLRREEKHHKERIYHHDDSRREEKHHKERIYHHDDGNAYGRKKELSDIPYVETNKKHGYKHEPETIEKNIYGHNDRGRKERNGYKHEPGTMETRDKTRSPTREKEAGEKSTGKVKDEDAIRSKSTYNSSLPPPYVKLNIPPPYSKPHNASNSEKMKEEAEHDIMQLPKPKSVRRKHRHKHSKSSSGHEDIGSSEDARIVKRISSSKRKDRKGLQILFDDEQYRSHRDDEEKMMDKLLLHYSKKPSSGYDIEKLRRKKNRSNMNSKSPSPHHNDAEMSVPPTRSISLPHESGEVEPKKVYARANSFQPDNQAKHVHPKLPDYDDLAARFAALRGR
ncbi:putative vacuolar protein sorting-associated protein Ist1 [Helianthus annuus]|nr:putative vacuolar protein sorting-associated protein Ist1 [Helianthus annuus]KAJ0738273.1 putative vacuolar protein sorting-associated protein Ist1 [Helianthus annuus]KAJ0741165.1 putative vacuolar protein sorting-associated protein Ist1 [Helianthus annuus]